MAILKATYSGEVNVGNKKEKSSAAEAELKKFSASLRGPHIGIPMVHMVMDYAAGDMAVAEVKIALAKVLPREWHIDFTGVHSFKTTETGFVVGQLALTPRDPADPPRILYVNCAPRKDQLGSRHDNEGEGLVYGELGNGVKVVAVNSKYSLSLLREHFTILREIRAGKGGSQFRSRDNFPPFVGAVAQAADISGWLGEELNPLQVVKQFKEGYIGYIDSFGNLKTTYRQSSARLKNLKPGQEVFIDINGTEVVARVATGSFNVPEGNCAFSPGSSGWDNRFWEVFVRGGNAAASFGWPQVGAEVKLQVEKGD